MKTYNTGRYGAVSIQPSIVWYVVLDVPYRGFQAKLKKADDVRLYEVSPSSSPLFKSARLGLLVAGKTESEAYDTALELVDIYCRA